MESGLFSKHFKKPVHFWRRFAASLLDISVIYFLACILKLLINFKYYVPFSLVLFFTLAVYYLITYQFMKGQTPGKVFSKLKITDKKGSTPRFNRLLFREVLLKGFLGLTVPFYYFTELAARTNYIKISIQMGLVCLFSLAFLFIVRTSWWDIISGTLISRNPDKKYRKLSYTVIIASSLLGIFVSIYPFMGKWDNFLTEYPFEYPVTREVKRYSDFLDKQTQKPTDYIFELFKKYDIVVISERMHPEYSQYEMIYEIIKDQRFSREIGNLFTECGSISCQDSIDHYLISQFPDEDSLNRATAILQENSTAIWPYWNNTNLFDLFKTVYTRNKQLNENERINWYFTDLPVNWNRSSRQTYIANYTNLKRDSLMAAQVVTRYRQTLVNQSRKKALVIMNSYHGYGLSAEGKNCFYSTAGYIMKELPGKVANVLINSISMKYFMVFYPVLDGKWDAAFKYNGNTPKAFNFEGSPFGDDIFDSRAELIKGLRYKDVFTGFIFYTPLNKQFCKYDFPFEFEKTEAKMIKRGSIISEDYATGIRNIASYIRANPKNPFTINPAKTPIFYNAIHSILIPLIWLIIAIIISIVMIFKK